MYQVKWQLHLQRSMYASESAEGSAGLLLRRLCVSKEGIMVRCCKAMRGGLCGSFLHADQAKSKAELIAGYGCCA